MNIEIKNKEEKEIQFKHVDVGNVFYLSADKNTFYLKVNDEYCRHNVYCFDKKTTLFFSNSFLVVIADAELTISR